MIMKIYLPLFSLVLFLFSGCGYHAGSIMHPQIKSIAIAPVVNDTLEPNVAAEMRAALSERFMVDGSLKVKSLHEADCILYCRIKEAKTTATQEDTKDNEQNYRPAEWGVEVIGEFSVIIPGRKEPLVATREISGTALYQVLADYDITRRRGVYMACWNAAGEIVQYTTEAW